MTAAELQRHYDAGALYRPDELTPAEYLQADPGQGSGLIALCVGALSGAAVALLATWVF